MAVPDDSFRIVIIGAGFSGVCLGIQLRRHILDCLYKMRRRGIAAIEIDPKVQKAYDERLQQELQRTVGVRVDRSWYKQAVGRVTNNWSGSTTHYGWHTRYARLGRYRNRLRARGNDSARTTGLATQAAR